MLSIYIYIYVYIYIYIHIYKYIDIYKYTYIRRKFRSETYNNMDRWKSTGRSSAMEKVRSDKIRDEKYQTGRYGRKVAKHSVFPMFCGSRGSKSRLAKAAGAEAPGQMRDEKVSF